MPVLTDYIKTATIRALQEAFDDVAEVPILICDPQGAPFTRPAGQDSAAPVPTDRNLSLPVIVDDEVVARVALAGPPEAGVGSAEWKGRFLRLMARVIGLIVERQKRLRSRVAELATLYRLTSEFTSQQDVQNVLDLVAKTVVTAMDARACSIRLLNEDRTELVVKAVANLSPEYLNKGPILLSESKIDQEVLDKGEPVCVADERTDPRVLYPAEATREGIVSALCAPMVYKGRTEGVVRVYKARRHEFDWYEVSLLKAISSEAAGAVVNARLYTESVRAGNMRRALQTAGVVQRRMIPASPPQPPGFDISAVYVPCFDLGGDFYDFIPLGEDNLGIAVCDVVGKGVRASLLMASIRASLRAHAASIYELSEVLRRVNADLCADTAVNDFATLFYGVLEVGTRQFTYANGGHTPPLLLRDGQAGRLTAGGRILGLDTGGAWQHEMLQLRSGDVIFACTDGLPEAMDFNDETFGRERVEAAALAAIADERTADGIVKHVLWEMRRFAGLHKRFDDITIVAVKTL